jgi:hypothetical protein
MELTIEEQKAYRDEQVLKLLKSKPKRKRKAKPKAKAKAKPKPKPAKVEPKPPTVPDDAQEMWTPELAESEQK